MKYPSASELYLQPFKVKTLCAADTRSCLGITEGCKYVHDSVYRASEIEFEWYFFCAFCKANSQ